MRIIPINNTNQSTNFNARIAPNPEWNNYLRYINEYAPYREGVYNTAKNKTIISKFIEALEANSSDALINIDTIVCNKDEMFNTRGRISSQYGVFVDTEPARDDSNAPIENIIRRILNPENRAQMCKLFGTKNFLEQSKWWDEHICSMWKGIQEVFYERTLFPRSGDRLIGRDESWYDSLWNRQFREQNPAD